MGPDSNIIYLSGPLNMASFIDLGDHDETEFIDLREEPKKKLPFRFSGIQIHLTYAEAKDEWTCESMLAALTEKFCPYLILEYSIGEEIGKEKKKKHFHCYIKTDRKMNVRSQRRWDIEGVHPNIQKGHVATIKYTQKDGKFITNITGKPGYIEMAVNGCLREAEKCFSEKHPKEYVLHLQTVRCHLRMLSVKDIRLVYQGCFDKHLTRCLSGWNIGTKTLFITGKSGVGKTQLAITLLRKPLVVRHMDHLKKLNESHKGIIFDDMSFAHLPRVSNIHLVDIEVESQINVKHGCVCIPAGMPRIITTNEKFLDFFAEDKHGAIERRVYEIEML